MRFYLSIILFVFLLLVAFVFGSQNEQTIELSYLVARSELSVAKAVALFTLIGFTLGVLASFIWRVNRRLKQRKKLPDNLLSAKSAK